MGRSTSRTRPTVALAGAAALVAVGFATGPSAQAADADTPVFLDTASTFGVLAGAGITNTGPTTINGDIGSYPTTSQTIPGVTLNGTNHGGGGVTQGAKGDLVTAYDEAAAASSTPVVTELGGRTLQRGAYSNATELGLTGTLTLDGGNADGTPSDAVFIFQAGTTLVTAVDSEVVLTGGAQACNVFWQVGSAATFNVRTEFVGTVMAYTEAITALTGATFEGRLLARDGAVTLDSNTITRPGCLAAPDADDGDDTTGGDEGTDGTTDGGDGTDADGTTDDGDGTDADGATDDGGSPDADVDDSLGDGDAGGSDADLDTDTDTSSGGGLGVDGDTDGSLTAGPGGPGSGLPGAGAPAGPLALAGMGAAGLGLLAAGAVVLRHRRRES